MPKSVDYSKSMIYKICCKDCNIKKIFIGGTTSIYSRKSKHKKECEDPENERYNDYLNRYIRENGGFKNFNCLVIEHFKDCIDKQDLNNRVYEKQKEHKATLHLNLHEQDADTAGDVDPDNQAPTIYIDKYMLDIFDEAIEKKSMMKPQTKYQKEQHDLLLKFHEKLNTIFKINNVI